MNQLAKYTIVVLVAVAALAAVNGYMLSIQGGAPVAAAPLVRDVTARHGPAFSKLGSARLALEYLLARPTLAVLDDVFCFAGWADVKERIVRWCNLIIGHVMSCLTGMLSQYTECVRAEISTRRGHTVIGVFALK